MLSTDSGNLPLSIIRLLLALKDISEESFFPPFKLQASQTWQISLSCFSRDLESVAFKRFKLVRTPAGAL